MDLNLTKTGEIPIEDFKRLTEKMFPKWSTQDTKINRLNQLMTYVSVGHGIIIQKKNNLFFLYKELKNILA